MLNIVATEDGWILDRYANELVKHIPGATRSELPKPNAVNFYVPYYLYDDPTLLDVALFTHREDSDDPAARRKRRKFDDVALQVNHCVAMSRRTATLLPSEKTTVVEIPVDSSFQRECIVLGVCAQEQPFGRKGFDAIGELAKIPRVQIQLTNGKLEQHEVAPWLRSVDYVLILGTNEGGPMAVKEALACGRPVIAPDVGWAWDYPCYRYEGIDDLKRLVARLAAPQDDWNAAARAIMEVVARELENGRHRSEAIAACR